MIPGTMVADCGTTLGGEVLTGALTIGAIPTGTAATTGTAIIGVVTAGAVTTGEIVTGTTTIHGADTLGQTAVVLWDIQATRVAHVQVMQLVLTAVV